LTEHEVDSDSFFPLVWLCVYVSACEVRLFIREKKSSSRLG
jgi:hypothetical protein